MKKKALISIVMVLAIVATLFMGVTFVQAETIRVTGAESANVIPSKISDFEGVTVGETPVNSGTYDKAEWGIFRPYTSDNNWSKATFTTDNYVIIPQVVADPDTASGHGHVLKLQPKAHNASPRWAIRTQLYAEASKYPAAVEFIVKISVDIKKSDNNGAKLYFRKDAADTTTNLANSEVIKANNEWKTLTLEYTCTLAEITANNNEFYYNIYLVQVSTPTGPMYIDNVKATLVPVFEQEVTPEPTETPVVTAAPTETPVITPEPTPEVQYKANVIPSKISDFEGVTVGGTPVNSGTTYDKAEWGIFRPYTSDNNWNKATFTTDNYVIIPQVVEDSDTASGHGHVLKLQPKAHNASPRWAIRTELYEEASKYPTAVEFIVKISVDIKKSDNIGAKLYFRKDAADTTTNLANSEVITANNEWETLTLEYTCTLAELKANNNEFYYNIYLVQVSAPTGPIYLDNVKASITPTQTNSNKIEGANLDLGSTLTINYYADLDEDHKDAVLNVTRNGETVTVMGVFDETYKMYKFAYTGINPQCMVDNISASLKLDGKEIDAHENYSVKVYLTNLMKSSAEELDISEEKFEALKKVANDTLIYGREAQRYMNYNIDNLATEGVDINENGTLTVPDETFKEVQNTNTEYKVTSVTLNASNTIKVVYRIKLADEDGVSVKLTDSAGVLVKTTNADEYLVYSSDIKATEFAKPFTLTLTKDSIDVSTVTYSVNDYIKYVAEKGESSSSYNITKAISYYSQSAVNYIKVD